ncbi:MAG: hypothetical protein JW984_03070 [Deltaproteobacteria bacterium]|uniref:Uncharacterized protein n=1 Tax=Candidatus Zymogenus saltonus TaxID=2844893 RepID=A0A9D8KDC4_9DELT|nr:hypothetical protein [Candidatus Zymogenus saltonus]
MNGEGQNENGEVRGKMRSQWWVKEDWGKRWRQSDRLHAVGWAAIFIWAGLVLLAESTDYVANFYWWDGWFVFFAGAGIIVLIQAVVRALVPAFRRRVITTFVIGFILLSIGLGELFGLLWPFLLISIGIIILVRSFVGRS